MLAAVAVAGAALAAPGRVAATPSEVPPITIPPPPPLPPEADPILAVLAPGVSRACDTVGFAMLLLATAEGLAPGLDLRTVVLPATGPVYVACGLVEPPATSPRCPVDDQVDGATAALLAPPLRVVGGLLDTVAALEHAAGGLTGEALTRLLGQVLQCGAAPASGDPVLPPPAAPTGDGTAPAPLPTAAGAEVAAPSRSGEVALPPDARGPSSTRTAGDAVVMRTPDLLASTVELDGTARALTSALFLVGAVLLWHRSGRVAG